MRPRFATAVQACGLDVKAVLYLTCACHCRLLEDKSGVVVQGLEEAIVRSAAEIYQVLWQWLQRCSTEPSEEGTRARAATCA